MPGIAFDVSRFEVLFGRRLLSSPFPEITIDGARRRDCGQFIDFAGHKAKVQ
jgi:hypothetical protein